MGYYMGDASAARHQGGLFSFVGKALRKVAGAAIGIAFPGVTSVLRAATAGLGGGQMPQGTFSPSTPPGVPPMASTSPLLVPVHQAQPQRRPKAPKAARNLSGKTLRLSSRNAAALAHRRRTNLATRARLRRAGVI